MKSLKINLEDNCDKEKLIELLILIKGIKSIEIISENEESTDLRKIIDKSKEQLKSEIMNLLSTIYSILSPTKNPKII